MEDKTVNIFSILRNKLKIVYVEYETKRIRSA
jgi:hypothetical protein